MNTKTAESNSIKAWGLLILLALIWGTSFIFVKKCVVIFSGTQVGSFRIMMAGLVFVPWMLKNRANYPKAKTKYLIASGLLGYLLPAFLFAIAGTQINSSLAGTLNATTPLFVLLVGTAFFQQKIKSKQFIGLMMGFVGSLMLILIGKEGDLSFDNPYVLLVVLATIMYGFNVNIVGKYLKDVDSVALSAWTLLGVSLTAAIVLFSTDFIAKLSLPGAGILVFYMFILGAVNSGVAAIIFNYILKITSPVFASSVTYLIPIVATIMGSIDSEQIFIWHYLGMVVILVGVYIINKK